MKPANDNNPHADIIIIVKAYGILFAVCGLMYYVLHAIV